MKKTIKIFPDTASLNLFAAEKFVEIAQQAIQARGRFSVALSGGSTPRELYRLLASEKFRHRLDWKRAFFFFGDERNVLPDHEESNYRLANETLFSELKIEKDKIFRWETIVEDAEEIAADYSDAVEFFFRGFPEFDLILLGLGADAHTASLFPFTEALRETGKIAAANPVEKLRTTRLTLTFPVINNARHVIFLVAGEEKASAVESVLEGEYRPDEFPAQGVAPEKGELVWLVEEKAAKLIDAETRKE